MKWKLCVLLSVAVAASVGAQSQTLPELAAQATEPTIKVNRIREIVSLELGELLAKTDMVVRGRVAPLRTYLSDDQRAIYTDYVMSPGQVVATRRARLDKPTMGLNAITFTHFGGDMTFNNVTVEVRDANLPPFQTNTEMIVLLQRSDGGTSPRFKVVDSIAAFEVKNGTVHPMMVPPLKLEEYRGMPDKEFISRVVSAYKP